jgi:hypothetical protein
VSPFRVKLQNIECKFTLPQRNQYGTTVVNVTGDLKDGYKFVMLKLTTNYTDGLSINL